MQQKCPQDLKVLCPCPTSLCSVILSSGGGIHEARDTVGDQVPGAAEGPTQGRPGRPGREQPGVPVGPVDSGVMMLSGFKFLAQSHSAL